MIDILHEKECSRIFRLTAVTCSKLKWVRNGVERTNFCRLERMGRFDASIRLQTQGDHRGGIFAAPIDIAWADIISIEDAANAP